MFWQLEVLVWLKQVSFEGVWVRIHTLPRGVVIRSSMVKLLLLLSLLALTAIFCEFLKPTNTSFSLFQVWFAKRLGKFVVPANTMVLVLFKKLALSTSKKGK
jgi:hypothetical protein